jgi:hypothetical protein
MIRHLASAAIAAALLVGTVGCKIPDPATAPAPEPAPVEWVVESTLYSRGEDIRWVICVPAADLELPPTEREEWKEVVPEDPAIAVNADEGDPCPEGEPR